jgi:hypothetical protein
MSILSPLNDASWPGPNCAGAGGTPAPNTTQSASGMHASLYTGKAAVGNDKSINGPHASGAATTPLLVVTDTGTVWV